MIPLSRLYIKDEDVVYDILPAETMVSSAALKGSEKTVYDAMNQFIVFFLTMLSDSSPK